MTVDSDDYVLSVEHISKKFNLDQKHKDRFPEAISNVFKTVFGGKTRQGSDDFWALQDISFKLHKGEVVGIIGKNGAGKSTLLKILSEISEPTSGRIVIRGRVASILEIGTGFHPELSGRENIYLSGSILGMKKAEIESRFSEIVDFSGVKDFIDVPVKRYSSGMFIRLAFSVVTHLDTDIVLLDEVLSVGDSEFGIRSFNKIKEMVDNGKTIILVTHDLGAVAHLCQKCIVLENGQVKAIGKPVDLLGEYMVDTLIGFQQAKDESENDKSDLQEKGHIENEHDFGDEKEDGKRIEPVVSGQRKKLSRLMVWENQQNAPGNDLVKLKSLRVDALNKTQDEDIMMNDSIEIILVYEKIFQKKTNLSFLITHQLRNPLMSITPFRAVNPNKLADDFEPGIYEAKCSFPANFFNLGIFSLDVFFVTQEDQAMFYTNYLMNFEIKIATNPDADFVYDGQFPGPLFPLGNWEVKKVE